MPAKEKPSRDGHDRLVEKAAETLRNAGRWPEHNVLRILSDDQLESIIAYWSGPVYVA
jgi:hypothetical protein